MNKRTVGTVYEQKAAAYLKENGFHLLESNFRCRQGEIDIVGIHQECLVFVEVKYRKNLRAGYPEEAVDCRKQAKICRTSDCFRYLHPEYGRMQIRYDVVTICEERFKWYQNAFDYIVGGYGRGRKF